MIPSHLLNSHGDKNTRLWWKAAFRTTFERPGSMWRGDPPHTYMTPPVHLGRLSGKRVFRFNKGSFAKIPAADIAWAFKVLMKISGFMLINPIELYAVKK